MISPPVLALYDCNRRTKLSSDASAYWLGGVVSQQQDDESWKPIAYFSRALTNVEAHYSPIEKECLGFTWVCERASDYILGKPIIGETNHKPLIIADVNNASFRPVATTNRKISYAYDEIQHFNIESMVHVPGKEMYAPDTLSRMLAKNTNTAHKFKNAHDFNAETRSICLFSFRCSFSIRCSIAVDN